MILPGFARPMIGVSGGAPVEFIAATSGYGNPSATVNKPTGVVDGDFMIAAGLNGFLDPISLSGWTAVVSGSAGFGVWTKIASSEPSSYTVSGGFGNVSGIIQAYRNASSVDIASSVSATETAASITATVDGALIGIFGRTTATSASSGPSGMTNRIFEISGNPALYGYDLLPSLAGATGSKTITWVGTTGNIRSILVQIA